ncbi:MAG: hypothetical protein LBF27_31805 [Sphingobacterium sp.]|jgi:hypothetical protein|nr:hypothetical protein [Sphingobacterium sp.]
MFGVESIFFRRCLFLLPIFVLASRANGQQLTTFNNREDNFRFVNRWIDPFFPLNTPANVVYLDLDVNDKTKNAVAREKNIDRVEEPVTEVSSPAMEDRKDKGTIIYSSSHKSTLYRVALDKQIDERYEGKQVFVDSKGVKYVIDSKYRKKIIK